MNVVAIAEPRLQFINYNNLAAAVMPLFNLTINVFGVNNTSVKTDLGMIHIFDATYSVF